MSKTRISADLYSNAMQSIEKDLKYCPQCQDEYRPDFEVCGVCGHELIRGESLLEISQKLKEDNETRKVASGDGDNELVTIQAGSLMDMKSIKRTFEKYGIGAVLLKDDQCGGSCCGPTISLQVPKTDFYAAQSILHELHREHTGLNQAKADNNHLMAGQCSVESCPACGFTLQEEVKECPDCGIFLS